MATLPGQIGTFVSNIFGRSDGGTPAQSGAAPALPDAHVTPQQLPNADGGNRPTNNTAIDPSRVKETSSPMDSWKDLWQPVDTSKSGIDNTLPENLFAGVDPAKMLEAARKVDFAKSIPPEVLAKIVAGGPAAAEAFAAAMNDIGQRAYAQSSFSTTKIVEAALKKYQEGVEKRLPSRIRDSQIADTIRTSNPALQHPAAAPIIEALQSQISVKYPNATVAEIKDMATQYLLQFSALVNPPPAAPQVSASEDWEAFLKG